MWCSEHFVDLLYRSVSVFAQVPTDGKARVGFDFESETAMKY